MRKKVLFISAEDYLVTRKNLWVKFLVAMAPALIVGVLLYVASPNTTIIIADVFAEFINAQISAVAILISFSVAIITIRVTADNPNITHLKEKYSTDCKPLRGKPLNLFQVLLSNITYNVVVEALYLGVLVMLTFVRLYVSEDVYKALMSICIFLIVHILHNLLESVGQMYLTFWKHEDSNT